MTIQDLLRKTECEPRTVRPAVNIYEKEDRVILEAEMPNMERKDIGIEVNGNDLIITGKRASDIPKEYTVIVQERCPVDYRRVFTLGSDIDRNSISATYTNGVLALTLSKTKDAQPRKITVA